MAIQTVNGGLWIPSSYPYAVSTPGFAAGGTLSSAAGRLAFVFQVPKTGTLDWFELRQQANTNTPDNGCRFSFQDVDASGNPDDTEDQYSVITSGFAAGAWLVPPSYMGTGGGGSGSKRSVSRGDWLACSVRFESFVASDNISLSVLDQSARVSPNYHLNAYIASSADSGTTYSKTTVGGINLALKYDDGTYAYIDAPHGAYSALTATSFTNAASPDERGLLFQLPFPARLAGIQVRIAVGVFDIVLYDSSSSVLATLNSYAYSTVAANGVWMLPTPQSLTKNVNYRAVIKPGVASVTEFVQEFNVSAIRAANPGGSTWKYTGRTDGGSWSETDTKLPFIGLVLDGFDDATGGGGGGEHSAVF